MTTIFLQHLKLIEELTLFERGDVELLAVFGDGAAHHLDTETLLDLLMQDLVAERFLLVFARNEPLQEMFYLRSRHIADRIGEEILESKDTAFAFEVLVADGTGDRRFVEPQLVGHILQAQRFEFASHEKGVLFFYQHQGDIVH